MNLTLFHSPRALRPFRKFLSALGLALALGGCASSPDTTVHGELLDAQVTAARVQLALQKGGRELQNVHAEAATDGTVVLRGTVASAQVRTRAEKLARGVHRELKLRDELQVQHPAGGSAR